MLNFANDSSKCLGINCPFSLKIVVNPHAAASPTIGWDRGGTGRQICDGSGLCVQEGRQRDQHIIPKSSTELGTQWALSDHILMMEWNVSSLLLRYILQNLPNPPSTPSLPELSPVLVGLRAPDADERASGSCQTKLGGGQAQSWGNARHHPLPGKPATLALLPFQIIFKVCFSSLEQIYCLGGKPNP